jgi:uncharacterized protein (TIGR03067 family)
MPLLSVFLLFSSIAVNTCLHYSSPDVSGRDDATTTVSLEGTWVLKSASWCGRLLPLTEDEKRRWIWTFSGQHFKHRLPEDGDDAKGTYSIAVAKSAHHLDLRYTKDEELGVRKCLFVLDGKTLKVAYSIPFKPGTPEQELAEAKKMFATRPKSFESGPDDSTLVLIFELQKK